MKRGIAWLVTVVFLVSLLTEAAYASNEYGRITTVKYVVESEYTVLIPSSIFINDSDYFDIEVDKCTIGAGKKLCVELDTSYSNINNASIQLSKDDMSGKTLPCLVCVGTPSDEFPDGYHYMPISFSEFVVAEFANGSSRADTYGRVKFIPDLDGVSAGTYSTTIRFIISIKDAVE